MTGARRILVVDDDRDIRGMVKLVLETEGYAVDLAADGFAALRSVESTKPDCVVLDVMMPGLDGHAVLRRIRSSAVPALPVVMLTAVDGDDQMWRAWTEASTTSSRSRSTPTSCAPGCARGSGSGSSVPTGRGRRPSCA